MKLRIVLVGCFFLAGISICSAQDTSRLEIKLLAMKTGKPVPVGWVYVTEADGTQHISDIDKNGIVKFKPSRLKRDSGFLVVRVAMDTLTSFTVYRNKPYDLKITLYADTEAIRRRNDAMKNRETKPRRREDDEQITNDISSVLNNPPRLTP